MSISTISQNHFNHSEGNTTFIIKKFELNPRDYYTLSYGGIDFKFLKSTNYMYISDFKNFFEINNLLNNNKSILDYNLKCSKLLNIYIHDLIKYEFAPDSNTVIYSVNYIIGLKFYSRLNSRFNQIINNWIIEILDLFKIFLTGSSKDTNEMILKLRETNLYIKFNTVVNSLNNISIDQKELNIILQLHFENKFIESK
jgi:hypothetical protein